MNKEQAGAEVVSSNERSIEDAARTSEYWKAELLAANAVIGRQRATIEFVSKQVRSITPDWAAVMRWLDDSIALDKPLQVDTSPETCERLRDCEISLGTFDPGATSEYWLKYGAPAKTEPARCRHNRNAATCDTCWALGDEPT